MEISNETMQNVIDYLVTRPYKEVYMIISDIMKAVAADSKNQEKKNEDTPAT